MSRRFLKLKNALSVFDAQPDDAVIPTDVTAAVTGLSTRTIRYHPQLRRHYVSADRYGFRAGDIRRLLREGAALSSDVLRLVQEVSIAPDRAAAEATIKQFNFEKVTEPARERLMGQLADIVAELPQSPD
jgi:hypothetical protein